MSTAAIITLAVCGLLAWCATLAAAIQIVETRAVYGPDASNENKRQPQP